MSKSVKLGTVLNRTASYLVSNGQILKSAPLNANASLFRYALTRNIRLVNPESIKGLNILDELHSHAKVMPPAIVKEFGFANVV